MLSFTSPPMKTALLLFALFSISGSAADDAFANIVLRGLSQDVVVIQQRGADHNIILKGSKPAEGFTVKKVNWSTVPGGSTVVLINERGEEGTVRFDQNQIFPSETPAPLLKDPAPRRQPSVSGPAGDAFANIVLRGLSQDVVVIYQHGTDHRILLKGSKPTEGFTVKKVNWSTVPGASTVVLINERGEEGTVRFDRNLVFPSRPSLPPLGNPVPRRQP